MVAGGCGILFPAATTMLFPLSFALLVAAAFTLDEQGQPGRRRDADRGLPATAVRGLALLVPLTVGAVLLVAGALRGLALPWGSTALALAGNVLLGFAVAAVGRTRTGEPGAAASAAVVLILILPGTVPLVSHWVHTFPASGGDGLPSDTVWWTVLALSAGGRRRIGQRTAAPRPPMTSNVLATMPVSVQRLGTLRLQRHPPCQARNQSQNSQFCIPACRYAAVMLVVVSALDGAASPLKGPPG